MDMRQSLSLQENRMKRTTGDANFDDRLSCVVDFLHY